jgi:hypothetical protein
MNPSINPVIAGRLRYRAEQAVLKMSWFVAPNMTLGQFNQMAEFIYQELVIAYQRTAL